MGVDAQQFTTLHKDKISVIQLQFGKYIKDLQQLRQPLGLAPAPASMLDSFVKLGQPSGLAPAPGIRQPSGLALAPGIRQLLGPALVPGSMPAPFVIEITPKGYPVVPDISFEKLKKEELEDLMRNYLSKHYSASFHTFIQCQSFT